MKKVLISTVICLAMTVLITSCSSPTETSSKKNRPDSQTKVLQIGEIECLTDISSDNLKLAADAGGLL